MDNESSSNKEPEKEPEKDNTFLINTRRLPCCPHSSMEDYFEAHKIPDSD